MRYNFYLLSVLNLNSKLHSKHVHRFGNTVDVPFTPEEPSHVISCSSRGFLSDHLCILTVMDLATPEAKSTYSGRITQQYSNIKAYFLRKDLSAFEFPTDFTHYAPASPQYTHFHDVFIKLAPCHSVGYRLHTKTCITEGKPGKTSMTMRKDT